MEAYRLEASPDGGPGFSRLNKPDIYIPVPGGRSWRPIPVDADVIKGAWIIQDRFRLSWWDALIVSAAQFGDCSFLLTEDLHENKVIGKVRIINPFLNPPESFQKESMSR